MLLIRGCEMFLRIGEHVYKQLHYCRSGTYFCTLVLKMQRVSLLGRTGNISVLGGKDNSTKELIHDGRTWKRKRSSLHHSGRQKER